MYLSTYHQLVERFTDPNDRRIIRVRVTEKGHEFCLKQREKTKKHLESLGITINSTIKVLSRSGGNVICIVKDGRLALDSNLSTKILVA